MRPFITHPSCGFRPEKAIIDRLFRKLFLFLAIVGSNLIGTNIWAQTTLTIGGGTLASTGNGVPIYRSSATSGFHHSKSVQLVTAADAAAVGLAPQSSISKWGYELNAAAGVSGNNAYTLNVWLKNSTATALASGTSWSTMTTGATLVYTATVNASVMPSTTNGYWLWNLTTPFTYTGGAIECYIEWMPSGTLTSPFTSGAFSWRYSSSTPGRAMGTSNSAALPGTHATYSLQAFRYNTRFEATMPPCVGQPNAGIASSSVVTSCPGVSFTLSATGLSSGSGLSYQWESSTDGGTTWSSVVGATSPIVSLSQSVQTMYRVISTCAPSSASAISSTVIVDAAVPGCASPCYNLTGIPSTTGDEEISNVTIGSFTNSSNCTVAAPGVGSLLNRYSNFTGLSSPPSFGQYSFVPFSITQTSCGTSPYTHIIQAYVDWNQDGDWLDADERVYNELTGVSALTRTINGVFQVPPTALPGITRMRIITNETSSGSTNFAHTAYSYGETEDYCFEVTATPPCASLPNQGLVTSNNLTVCPSTTANFLLTASNLTSGPGISYQWESSVDQINWNPIAGATGITYSGSQTVPTYYRISTTCVGFGTNSSSGILISLIPAQAVPYSEGLESTTFPPQCGQNIQSNPTGVTGVGLWVRQTAGTAPIASPAIGSAMAVFQSRTFAAGVTADLILPRIALTNPSQGYLVQFQMFRDNSLTYANISDSLEVFFNPSSPSVVGAIKLMRIHRSTTLDPVTTVSGWNNYSVSLPSGYVNIEGYIIFRATGRAGNNIYLDAINVVEPCLGTPNPGLVSASASAVCSLSSVTLNASGYSLGGGIVYQWFSSVNGGSTWDTIPNAVTPSITRSQSIPTDYQIATFCSFSGQTSYSSPIFVGITTSTCECATYNLTGIASSTADEDIGNVTIGAFSNSSTCASTVSGNGSITSRYSNYTNLPNSPVAQQLDIVPFSLSSITCGGNFNNFFQLYADWNQDGDWLDAGEQVFSQPASVSGPQTVTGTFTIPLSALPGVCRIRVVNIETSASTLNYAHTGYTWGETEDYCLSITPAPICLGAPNAGVINSSFTDVCPSRNFTLNLGGATNGLGISYLWEKSNNAGASWDTIFGANSSIITIQQTLATTYRVTTSCLYSQLSATSPDIFVGMVMPGCQSSCYEIFAATSTADEDISNVTVGNFSNSSTCATVVAGSGSISQRYSNFTNLSTNPVASQGDTVLFSFSQNSCGGAYSNFFQAYVDWNQDGDFSDLGEQVYNQPTAVSGNHTVSGSFVVSPFAMVGLTRMRVVNIEAAASNINYAQTNYTWGETEDYCFEVTPGQLCSGTPNVPVVTASAPAICAQTSLTLTGSNLSFGVGTAFLWESSTNNGNTWTQIPNAFGTSVTLNSQSLPTLYRLTASCAVSGIVSVSQPVSVGLLSGACECGTYNLVGIASSTTDEDISNVTIGNFSNSSSCSTVVTGAGSILNRYSNYTDLGNGPVAMQLESVPFSLTQIMCGSFAYTNLFQIYVDWNQDGDFLDSLEKVFTESSGVSALTRTITGSFDVPDFALPGVTRMRVVNIENGSAIQNYAHTGYTWGETEDYCFTVTAAPLCAGLPVPGQISSSVTNACPSSSVTLTHSNATIGLGISRVWQRSLNGGATWDTIPNSVSSMIVVQQTQATSYRVIVTCSNSGQSDISPVYTQLMVSPDCQSTCYRIFAATSTADEDISDVTIGTFVNSSTCSTSVATPGPGSVLNRYSNYTGLSNSPSGSAGGTVPFILTQTTCGTTAYSHIFQIYVDWNQDGDFLEVDEKVFTETSGTSALTRTVAGNFSIPFNAATGTTRMRIVVVENGVAATNYAQTNYSWGETEDYCFTVMPPATNDIGVVQLLSPSQGCVLGSNESVTVRLFNFGLASQSNFPISYTINGGSPIIENFNGVINSRDSFDFTFNLSANLSASGTYAVTASTLLLSDSVPANNSITRTIANTVPMRVPFVRDLNQGFPDVVSTVDSRSFVAVATGGVNNTGFLRGTSTRSGVNSSTIATLTSKLFGPIVVGQKLEFEYAITGASTVPFVLASGDSDIVTISVSTDCGRTYQMIDMINSTNHSVTNAFALKSVSLDAYAGQNIYVQIQYIVRTSGLVSTTNSTSWLSIDNLKVWNPLSPRIASVSQAAATCTPTAHNVEAQIIVVPQGASLTQVNLQYDLTGLGYSSTPMTYNAANDRWVGTVPAGSINVPVRYRVTALDASSLVDTSLPRTYTDNYLTVFAGNDTTVTPGDTATLSASTTGFASSSMLRASTVGGNGSGGVTFNLRARNAITIDSILVPLSGSTATTVDVWYTTSPINGAPTVATPAWTQIVSGYSVTANNTGLTPTNLVGIPMPANFSMPSGAVYGFFVGSGATMIYTTYASQVDTFVDPNMVIYTGPNVGYGGSAPNPTFSTRQFCGAVSVRNPAAVAWMVQGTSTVLSTGPVFRVAPNATTTYVAMITDSVCTSTDAVTVFTVGQNQITGTFKYNNTPQTPMTNSTVECRDANNVVLMTAATDATGTYTMSGMTNGTYTVTGVTNKPWGGVNSVDALGIARSFTGAAPLVGLRVKAADVNGSNTINSLDALTTSRRFSGSIASFTVGNWAYEAVPTTVAGGVTTRNIMALAYGDVNGSYQPSTALRLDPRMMALNQGYMTASDLTILPVRIDRALSLGALSVVVELPAGVRAEAVRSALAKGDFDFHQNGNELRISWFSVDGVELSENDLLFSMELSGVSNLNASDLHFGELSEAASPLAEVYPLVGLRMPRVSGAGQEVSLYPNPARDLSQIRVRLNSTADVAVRVLDARGRQVADFMRHLDAGTQVLDLVTEGWSEGQYRVEISVLEGKEVRQHGFRLQVRK